MTRSKLNGPRTRRGIVALLILGGLIATPVPGASAGHGGQPYFDLAALPGTDYSGKQILDGLKQFVGDYPIRALGTPNEIRAGLALHDEMAALGYDAQICSLANATVNRCESGNIGSRLGAGIKVVMGTKRGTTRPDEWIMFIAHYDSFTTLEGAYDNASGTNLVRFLARELANVQTNRSLVFAFYNGEEEGLLASERHAQYLKNSGQKISAVMGFDMSGISYPVAAETGRSCLCMWHGPSDKEAFDPLLRYVNYDFLKFPNHPNKVAIRGTNARNSDELSFAEQGYPTLRWAGMKRASDYVGYHKPEDTIATIVAESGGETFYEQGAENTMKSAYYTTLTLDNHPPVPAATISKNGLEVSADARPSSDEDGPLSAYTWDFGDGTSGQGATAQHSYAAPGTYNVTLTVADNLWTQVTASRSFTVTLT